MKEKLKTKGEILKGIKDKETEQLLGSSAAKPS